jgi:hypothetical protein
MEYRGKVKDGVVVLEQGIALAEGTEVRVKPLTPGTTSATVWDKLLSLAGSAKGLPRDAGKQHDHYLYGTPKT